MPRPEVEKAAAAGVAAVPAMAERRSLSKRSKRMACRKSCMMVIWVAHYTPSPVPVEPMDDVSRDVSRSLLAEE